MLEEELPGLPSPLSYPCAMDTRPVLREMLDEGCRPWPSAPPPRPPTPQSLPQVTLEVVLLDLAPSDEADEAARADRAFNEQVRPGARTRARARALRGLASGSCSWPCHCSTAGLPAPSSQLPQSASHSA